MLAILLVLAMAAAGAARAQEPVRSRRARPGRTCSPATYAGIRGVVAAKGDVKTLENPAKAMARWMKQFPPQFPKGSEQGHNTRALPAVWTDNEGFRKTAGELADASTKLAELAKAGDADAVAAQVKVDGRRLHRLPPDVSGAVRRPLPRGEGGDYFTARTSRPGVAPVYCAVLEHRRARDQRRDVAIDTLHQPSSAGRQVVADLRHVQPQPLEVDHVDVGLQPRRQPAAVGEAEEVRRLAGLALDDQLQRQARPALPVAPPVRQHPARQRWRR